MNFSLVLAVCMFILGVASLSCSVFAKRKGKASMQSGTFLLSLLSLGISSVFFVEALDLWRL